MKNMSQNSIHNVTRLWQYPRDTYYEEDNEWFCNKPVGRDTLGAFMTKLSNKCGLSQNYANHTIRPTGATILSRQHFSNSQIMVVAGHKSVSSLAVYQIRTNFKWDLQYQMVYLQLHQMQRDKGLFCRQPRLLILFWLCRHQRHHTRCWLCHHQKCDVLC